MKSIAKLPLGWRRVTSHSSCQSMLVSFSLSKGRGSDGFPLGMEDFIRQAIKEFDFPDCTIFTQLVKIIAPVEKVLHLVQWRHKVLHLVQWRHKVLHLLQWHHKVLHLVQWRHKVLHLVQYTAILWHHKVHSSTLWRHKVLHLVLYTAVLCDVTRYSTLFSDVTSFSWSTVLSFCLANTNSNFLT